MQIRHAVPQIASALSIKHILCNAKGVMRTNTSGERRGFRDNYSDFDCSCRLRSAADVGVEEQDLLTCRNKVLMTVKQKYLLACCEGVGGSRAGSGDPTPTIRIT